MISLISSRKERMSYYVLVVRRIQSAWKREYRKEKRATFPEREIMLFTRMHISHFLPNSSIIFQLKAEECFIIFTHTSAHVRKKGTKQGSEKTTERRIAKSLFKREFERTKKHLRTQQFPRATIECCGRRGTETSPNAANMINKEF